MTTPTDREAKIAVLQLQAWSANNDGARRKATDALAAMARDPAPDGDATAEIERLRAQRDALLTLLEQCDVFLRVHANPDNELKADVQAAIAEREAKILAHEKWGDEIAARLIAGEDAYAQLGLGEYVRTTTHLLRSAPDGDVKLLELREFVRSPERMRDYFDDGSSADPVPFIHQGELIHQIDRLLFSKPSNPAPTEAPPMLTRDGSGVAPESSAAPFAFLALRLAEVLAENERRATELGEVRNAIDWYSTEGTIVERIDRLRAENERLQADLAAAVKAHQFAEASQKVEQGLAKSAEARVAHLERDLADARAETERLQRLVKIDYSRDGAILMLVQLHSDWDDEMPEKLEDGLRRFDSERNALLDKIDAAREELRTMTIDRDIKVENLTNARADQAAMARRELEHLQFDLCCPYPDAYQLVCRRLAALPAQQPNVTVRVLRGPVSEAVVFNDAQQPEPEPEFCGAAVRIVTGGTCANTKPCPTHDAVPVQWMAAGPEPDAATRDGDEVLREMAQWAGGEGTNELWRAVAELCRRELARGGK